MSDIEQALHQVQVLGSKLDIARENLLARKEELRTWLWDYWKLALVDDIAHVTFACELHRAMSTRFIITDKGVIRYSLLLASTGDYINLRHTIEDLQENSRITIATVKQMIYNSQL